MAIATMRVPTVFTAVDKFSHVVSKMTGSVNSFSKTAYSAVSRVDHKVNGIWSSMNGLTQLAVAGGLGGLFYSAGKDIANYETKIASLAAVTGTKIGAMNKEIESLGKETKRSVIDIAGSFEIVGSKMSQYLKNPEALKQITKESILLSQASRMELEPAIDALTGVMNIYGLAAKDANNIVNKLSAGEVVGSIKIEESVELLRQFGGTARLANVQVDESIALIQTLTKSMGVEGVGRGLRNMLLDISSTGNWDKKKLMAIKMVGANIGIIGDKTKTTVERLTELKKLSTNSTAMAMFFKRQGIQAAATLFQHFDEFEKFLDEIKKTNPAMEQAAKNTSTFSYAIDRLKDSFTNFIVSGDNSNRVLNIAKSLIIWMTNNMGGLINIIGFLAAAFLLWKTYVAAAAVRLFILNIAMGISAFRAGAMAIAMQGNAVAIGAYNLATVLATGSTATLGVSMMSVLAPLLLVVGAIGLLAYAFWDNNKATENYTQQSNAALDKKNIAWINSTKIQANELKKQNDLLKTSTSNVTNTPEFKKMKRILDEYNSVKSFQNKISVGKDMSGNKLPGYQKQNPELLTKMFQIGEMNKKFGVTQANVLRSNGFTYEDFKKIYPDSEKDKKQRGEIILRFEGLELKDFESKGDYDITPKGINPVLTPNQGSRDKHN